MLHDEVGSLANAKYCVYLHKRPDQSVFYVGKGTKHRAFEFSPSRRTPHHSNIVAKYGRENIVVQIIPCCSEFEAFALEKAHISILKAAGAVLANITDGGEGASGRKFTDEQTARHIDAVKRGWDKRGRKPKLGARFPELANCQHCSAVFSRATTRQRFCCENCQQRHSRGLTAKQPTKTYKTNTSGRTGVYFNKNTQKWLAMIGVNKKLKCLGTFSDWDSAVQAREAAEHDFGRGTNT